MGIFLWDTAPSKIFVWWAEVASVWAWDTKIRPMIQEAIVDFLLVWWGWAWGRWRNPWWWGWWAGWVVYCQWETLCSGSYSVTIWAWWQWNASQCLWACVSWCNSRFGTFVAFGWWGWGWMCGCGMWAWCPWASWWSWWGGSNWSANPWGNWCSGQWNNGGSGFFSMNGAAWWGGWYWSAWCPAYSCGFMQACWWNWGAWLTSDITWQSRIYAAWWWGSWPQWVWTSNWGGNGCKDNIWGNALCYWSWWWGSWSPNWNTCCRWWNWCQWIFVLRYPSSCNYQITWGSKYLCNWYCIHCFTSDWTLCIK